MKEGKTEKPTAEAVATEADGTRVDEMAGVVTETPPSSPDKQPKKKINRRILVLVIALVVALIGLGATFAYYKFSGKSAGDDQSKSASSKTDASNSQKWKTYTSDELDITFDYPAAWTYTDTGYSNDQWKQIRSYSAEFKPVDFCVEVNPWTVSASPLAHVYDNYKKVSTQAVKIDSVNATKETWQTTAVGAKAEGGAKKGIDYRFAHGSDKFRLHFGYKITDEKAQLANINKLITSFKFTGPGGSAQQSDEDGDDASDADSVSDSKTKGWATYTNTKYGYTFKYPSEYKTSGTCKTTSCLVVTDGGDTVSVQGDPTVERPTMVEITHTSTDFYNPPAGTNLLTWVPQHFPWFEDSIPAALNITLTRKNGGTIKGLDVTEPASPQAYSQRNIFYIASDGKMFRIFFLDVAPAASVEFYDAWLSEFRTQ